MGWSIGWDPSWSRDIGYGVPASCDHPNCRRVIDRGLSYVCGGEPYGGEKGCGLYFCGKHGGGYLCARCLAYDENSEADFVAFTPKPDHPRWVKHKATHPSWAQWRAEQAARG